MALLAYEDAISRVLRAITPLPNERVGLDAAAERVLGEDLCAVTPMPPFSHSAMDGYAVRAAHFAGSGPWELSVAGESRAGGPGPVLAPGASCRIFTGAPIPAGADAVIIQENVVRSGDRITTSERPHEGQNVRALGSDLKAGATALSTGARLTPGRLGLVAALDRAHVLVARRPVVAILSSGDELRPPGVPGPYGSIAESNSFVIAAMARRAGAIARVMPLLGDDVAESERQIRRALAGTDLLVTIGGASVGDHDVMRPAMEAVGVRLDFWGVAIKPGKPTAAGSHAGTKVLCLPGNPASASVVFMLFGVPMLRAMQGEPAPRPARVPLRVVGSHARRPGREEYLRARIEMHDGERCAVLPPSQASGAVTSVAEADALVVLAPNRERIDNGDRLPVVLLRELWGD